MDTTKTIAALFDFDGVIMDTELQYTIFWNEQGEKYLHVKNFGPGIKGQTLTQIYDKHFAGELVSVREQITSDLNLFEKDMAYEYLPGVQDFLVELRRHNVKIALVTSSNDEKMENVYRTHPEFKEQFDRILTGDMFKRSKPAPDCFLLGMEVFGTTPDTTYVFEDSFNGLKAGMASEATVIGLATTNPRESIAPLCHCVLDDFRGFTYDKMLQVHK